MSAFEEIDQAKLFQAIHLGIRDGLSDSFVIEEFKRGRTSMKTEILELIDNTRGEPTKELVKQVEALE